MKKEELDAYLNSRDAPVILLEGRRSMPEDIQQSARCYHQGQAHFGDSGLARNSTTTAFRCPARYSDIAEADASFLR